MCIRDRSYLDNPGSVPGQWREYFDQMQLVPGPGKGAEDRDVAHAPIIESFAMRAKQGTLRPAATQTDLTVARKQVYVQQLIAAYRVLGSRWDQLDPLKRQERTQIPELEPAFYDLTEADMDTQFVAASLYFGQERMTLRAIIKGLRETYCGSVGIEYMLSLIHISEPTRL